MSTINEVAARAKVSVATVSRVINEMPNVSAKTKDKVLKAIEELKYQPNAMGSLLRKDRTNMVLVLLHSVDNPFFSSIVQGIEEVAQHNNYNVLISTTYGQHKREQHYIKMLKQHFVDGIILITNTLNVEEINELSESYPLAQVLEYVPNSSEVYFSIDFYSVAKKVVEHLVNQGRKKIAFVHTGLIDIASTQAKYQAYKDVLEANHLEVITKELKNYPFGFESGKRIAKELLHLYPYIDGFFASSDLIAAGILDELKVRHIQVPKEVAVFGFDNTGYGQLTQPKLSTVDLNGFQMGKASMQYILDRLHKSNSIKKSILFGAQLLLNASTER